MGCKPILLVEDNKINQKVAGRLLQKLGYTPELAENGEEAVRAFESGRYTAVLMDCQMPVMDGFEATRRIRQLESGIRTPIIALTARALPEDRELCREAGMDGYLAKPIDLAALANALATWAPESGKPTGPSAHTSVGTAC